MVAVAAPAAEQWLPIRVARRPPLSVCLSLRVRTQELLLAQVRVWVAVLVLCPYKWRKKRNESARWHASL